jgi:transcriptional regulator with XRE-family HTH domain
MARMVPCRPYLALCVGHRNWQMSGLVDHRAMEDRRVGAVVRAVRQHLGLRQIDVASRAGVSQASVSLLERGRLAAISVPVARRIADVLDVRLSLNAWWRGGEADKLLDRAHAALVDYICGVLRSRGWTLKVEYVFAGPLGRGSVDVLAWHPVHRALCLIEVKSKLFDLQALLMTFARKVRAVPRSVGEEFGWRPERIGRLLVVAGTTANRSVVAEHGNVFGAAFPERGAAVRSWIREPLRDLAGVWFVSTNALSVGKHGNPARRRIRRRS